MTLVTAGPQDWTEHVLTRSVCFLNGFTFLRIIYMDLIKAKAEHLSTVPICHSVHFYNDEDFGEDRLE